MISQDGLGTIPLFLLSDGPHFPQPHIGNSTRIEDSRLPKGREARKEHAEVIGADGSLLLSTLYDSSAPAHLWELPAVQILRRTWVFQYYAEEGRVRWRKAEDLPPAGKHFDAPYDPEARFGNKRSITWTGYKVHLTEMCEDEEIHLITHVETTAVDGIPTFLLSQIPVKDPVGLIQTLVLPGPIQTRSIEEPLKIIGKAKIHQKTTQRRLKDDFVLLSRTVFRYASRDFYQNANPSPAGQSQKIHLIGPAQI